MDSSFFSTLDLCKDGEPNPKSKFVPFNIITFFDPGQKWTIKTSMMGFFFSSYCSTLRNNSIDTKMCIGENPLNGHNHVFFELNFRFLEDISEDEINDKTIHKMIRLFRKVLLNTLMKWD